MEKQTHSDPVSHTPVNDHTMTIALWIIGGIILVAAIVFLTFSPYL
jgi:hypothetical protein